MSSKNIKTKQLSKKLDYKQIKSIKTKNLIKSSYKLDLPSSMKINDIFYLYLLRPMATNLLLGQCNSPLLLVVVNEKEKKVKGQ